MNENLKMICAQLLKKHVTEKFRVRSSNFSLLMKQWASSVNTRNLLVEFILPDMRPSDTDPSV